MSQSMSEQDTSATDFRRVTISANFMLGRMYKNHLYHIRLTL